MPSGYNKDPNDEDKNNPLWELFLKRFYPRVLDKSYVYRIPGHWRRLWEAFKAGAECGHVLSNQRGDVKPENIAPTTPPEVRSVRPLQDMQFPENETERERQEANPDNR